VTPEKVIEKAKEYIWRNNPPPQMDSEGLENIRLLMATILELQGKMPPEDDVPVDKPYTEKHNEAPIAVAKKPHLPGHQVKMEF